MAEKQTKAPAIGIDLGTTITCVAFSQNGQAEIIESKDDGKRFTPSYVAFNDDERLIGHAAKMQMSQNVEHTIYNMKRFIGRFYDDNIVRDEIKTTFLK